MKTDVIYPFSKNTFGICIWINLAVYLEISSEQHHHLVESDKKKIGPKGNFMCSINMFTFRLPKILWTFMQTFMRDLKNNAKQLEWCHFLSVPPDMAAVAAAAKKKRKKRKNTTSSYLYIFFTIYYVARQRFPFFSLCSPAALFLHKRTDTESH